MVILELRGLHQELERKTGSIQREFSVVADQLAALRRKWSEVEEFERPKVIAEQEVLKEKQLLIAEQVNIWRDRLRAIESPRSEQALQTTLEELFQCGIEEIVAAVKESRRLMAMDPEERAAMLNKAEAMTSQTPVGRLIERALKSYDLRQGGPAVHQKEALAFANRTGIAQDDSMLKELENSLNQDDPIVADVATRTLVQILRFRAMRSAELEIINASVQRLTKVKHPAVIPVLIEILQTSRTGYMNTENGLQEESNSASRLKALIALVDWRTKEAQDAIRARTFDREPQIASAAERALEAFPGEWSGSSK